MTSNFNYTKSSEYTTYSSDDETSDSYEHGYDYEDDYENIFTDTSYMDEEYFYNTRLRVSGNIIINRAPLPINTYSNAKRKEIEEKRKQNEFTKINKKTEINISEHLNWLKQQKQENIYEPFLQIFEKEKIEKLQIEKIKNDNIREKENNKKNHWIENKNKEIENNRKNPWSKNENKNKEIVKIENKETEKNPWVKIENNSKVKNQMNEKYNLTKNPWYNDSKQTNEKNNSNNLQYTNMCKNIIEGKKCYNNCKYAHTLKELVINDCKFKESCNSVSKKNNVYINFKGKKCSYKHPGEKLNDYYRRVGLSKFINV